MTPDPQHAHPLRTAPRHLIVVGSGLAGLTAALRADSLGHDVTLVTKGALGESNSRYAQGGIAAAVFGDDTVPLHVNDTLAAGAGLSVRDAVEVLCADGALRIDDLVRWGVHFDDAAGDHGDTQHHDGWSRGLEAAHSRSRVLHAGGDATGRALVEALVATLRSRGIRLIEHAFLRDLLLDEASDVGARVVGVDLLVAPGRASDTAGQNLRIRGDAVILATGGAGQLYEFTTNPAGATADGLAAAWRAGATVEGLEFFQFHPTALAVPGSFLVSEAVRGEGAVLLDLGGRRFMAGVDPRAELAPRDIVARGIATQMTKQAGQPVLLDATGLGRSLLENRFPTITAATRAAGLDWATEPIPVTPAAHYFMGGVTTDLDGRTSLAGLYAVGEVAATGVHGANRLASNSLLDAAVFGWRAVEAAGADDALPAAAEGEASTPPGAEEASDDAAGRRILRAELQHRMWEQAGVARTGDGLRDAAAWLAEATVAVPSPGSEPAAMQEALETANLLAVARLVVAAALAREESRGAHYRADFPDPSDDLAHSRGWTRKVAEHAH